MIEILQTVVKLNNPHQKKVIHSNHCMYILSEKPQHLKRTKDFKLTTTTTKKKPEFSLEILLGRIGSKAAE